MKTVWHIDATAVAEFDSMDEALRAWADLEDEVFMTIGDTEFCVLKENIGIMTEEEFNTL